MSTVRCTMAQAVVRYLCNQFTVVDGERLPLFPGVFAIFGHGNVTCLSEALEAVKDVLPTWRGQNEQSMALAAIGFAKAKRRRQSWGRARDRFCVTGNLTHGRSRDLRSDSQPTDSTTSGASLLATLPPAKRTDDLGETLAFAARLATSEMD